MTYVLWYVCSQTSTSPQSPGGLAKMQNTGPHPRVSDSVGLGRVTELSFKHVSGNADAAGL